MDLPFPLHPMDLSAAAAPFRPACDAGVARPPSTSLKWGHDGELTALDLHHVLARLCEHDPQACRALEDGDTSLG
jgi:hypothetical protein